MRRYDDRSGVVLGLMPGGDPLEERLRRYVRPRQEEPGVQISSGLELHPADLPGGQEYRRQAQAARVLLDDLAGCAGACEEARSQIRELRLQGRARYDSCISARDKAPCHVACGIVAGRTTRRPRAVR